MRINFKPRKHGFHFSNSYIKWSFGPISGTALCGGMVYAALDYWYAGMSIPGQQDVPQQGSPVHEHIYKRQWHAHDKSLNKFMEHWIFNPDSKPKFERLKIYLGAGRPTPVCLYRGIGDGHHTLAIGVDQGSKVRIELYDPNFPDTVSVLEQSGDRYAEKPSGSWKGFFIDPGYFYVKPEILEGEFGWARCSACRLLYFPNGGDAPCPKGGAHRKQGSYVLNLNAGHGRANWKRCWKCNGLFYAGDPSSAGICPAGGIHNPAQGREYTLAVNGAGEPNWRRCIYCDGLFWLSGGGIGGVCPGGDRHESDLSVLYTIPYK